MAIQSLSPQIQELMNHGSTVFIPEVLSREFYWEERDVYVNIDKGFFLERNPVSGECRWNTNSDSATMYSQLYWSGVYGSTRFTDNTDTALLMDEDLNFFIEKSLTYKKFTFYTSAAANELSKKHKNSIPEGELRISALGDMGEKKDTISLTKREAKALHGFLSKMLA